MEWCVLNGTSECSQKIILNWFDPLLDGSGEGLKPSSEIINYRNNDIIVMTFRRSKDLDAIL